MAAPGVYGHRTLNDNWVEDRCQPAGSLSATGNYHKRFARPEETDLAYIGERYDVLGRISRMPARESYALPDDGFREKGTTNKTDLRDPRSHPMYAGKHMSAPSLIQPAMRRKVPEQRFFNTTHGDTFGEGSRKRTPKIDPSARGFAGVRSEDDENRVQGMKCGRLCGECFYETNDPAVDTRTQRAWLPGDDAAIRNVHLGGLRRSAPELDNDLSLPLGNGAMCKIRSDLKERKGRLCRVATSITKGAHLKAGVALFQDD